jgi:hypothetical protein
VQDHQVGDGEAVSFCCCCCFCDQGCRKEEEEEEEDGLPSGGGHSIDSDTSLAEVELEEEEEEEDKEKYEVIDELPVLEERPAGRLESPAAKRQRELVQKTSEDALRRGLETQRTAAAAQARMPVTIKPRVFWPKARLPAVTR